MALQTAFTQLLSVECPVVSAPTGGTAGGALAAAVSNAGGLGLVGGGSGEHDWVVRELALVTVLTRKPWGVGFQSWAVDADVVARALEFQPAAVMLSFGDPAPFVERIRAAGAKLLLQVTDLDEARQAVDVGTHVIVASCGLRPRPRALLAVPIVQFPPAIRVAMQGPRPEEIIDAATTIG